MKKEKGNIIILILDILFIIVFLIISLMNLFGGTGF
jgi:hypothetical protein